MCGIYGGISWGSPFPLRILHEWVKPYAIEVQDDAALYISEAGAVALGHRRLSIIDLSEKGRQPLWNEQNTIGLVFNGEIYNFQILRTELEE